MPIIRRINLNKIGRNSKAKILQAQGVSTNRQLLNKFYTADVSYRITIKKEDGGGSFLKKVAFPITQGLRSMLRSIYKEKENIQANSPTISVEIESKNILPIAPKAPTNTILTAPIKEAGAMDLDGCIKNEVWCKNLGECVPDWLKYKYTENRMKIKKFVKNNQLIQHYATHKYIDTLGEMVKVIDNEPNKDGYTIENIKLFCENCYLPVYILHNAKLIYHSRNAKDGHTKKGTPLVIEVKNNHLYPITDTSKIKSIVQIPQSSGVNKKSYETEAKEITGSVIYNTEYDDAMLFALETQLKADTQIYPRSIYLVGNKLSKFKLGDTTYMPFARDEEMERYLEKEHTTETAQSIARDFMKGVPQSFLNSQTLEALNRENVKNRNQHGLWIREEEEEEEEEEEVLNEKDHFTADLNKAYRSCMEQPMDDFMTIDFNSLVERAEKYDGNRFGLWFIETDDLSLLHQSNWYSNKMIEEAVLNGIEFEVKYFIRGKREGKTLLKEIIDKIVATDPEEQFKSIIKTIINSISGNLGKTHGKLVKLTIDNDIQRVWEDFFTQSHKYENNFIFKEHEGLYCWGRQTHTELLTTNLPMYIQILDWSNIMLDRLVRQLGGYDNLIYRKTDSITMRRLPHIVLKPSKEMGGYKIEDLPQKTPMMKYDRDVDYECKYYKYKKPANINCSDDWEGVIKLLEDGKGLLIDSRAGTGKTYILNKVIEHFGKEAVVRLAFTNKACNNIDGKTIHRFFAIDKDNKLSLEKMKKNMKGVKVVCIDEISMIGQDLWKHLYYLKRYYKHIPFVLCGEYRQLPPIENDPPRIKDGYFNHPTIRMLCDYNRVELQLTDKCRYDRILFDYLTNIAEGVSIDIDFKEATIEDYLFGANLVFTNSRRREINAIVNRHYADQTDNKFQVDFVAIPEVVDKYSQTTIVYDGLPLLSIVNHRNSEDEVDIVKNQTYKVVETDMVNRRFKIEDHDNWFEADDINKTFIVAYAMTIHKTQGDTIEGRVNIHEHTSIVSDEKLHYTAVSRAKDISLVKYFV